MNPNFQWLTPWLVVAAAILTVIVGYRFFIRILGMVIVPNNAVGIVTKKFGLGGRSANLPDGKIIALEGEAGIQADTLAPGLHFWLWPWQYTVHLVPFLTVEEGMIGIVEARDGVPLSGGRVLAKQVERLGNVLKVFSPLRREFHRAEVAYKQRTVQVFCEVGHMMPDGRLGNIQFYSGLLE